MLCKTFRCAIVFGGLHLLSAARTSANVRDELIALEEAGPPSAWVRAVLDDVGRLMWMEGAQSPLHPSAIFRKFDKDRSRHLEIDEFIKLVQFLLQEFRARLRSELVSEMATIGRINQLFDFVDANRNGHISYDEFVHAFQPVERAQESVRNAWINAVLYEVGALLLSEDVQGYSKTIFSQFDKDKNSRLDKAEFVKVVKHLLEKYVSRLSSFILEQSTKEHLEKLFDHVDASGDGFISYAEFAHAFRPVDRATTPQEALTKSVVSPWARSVLHRVGKLLWMEDAHGPFSPSAVFRSFDIHKSGKLGIHEFLKLVNSLLTEYGSRLPPLIRVDKANFARVNQLFQFVDASHDGHITYEEFMLAFQPGDRSTNPNDSPANLRVLVTSKFQEVGALLPGLRNGALSFANREFDRLLATLPMFSVRGESTAKDGMLNSSAVCACKMGGCFPGEKGVRNDRARELRDGRCCRFNKKALSPEWRKVSSRYCNSWPKAIDNMLETVKPSDNSTNEECKDQMRASLSSIKEIVNANNPSGTHVYSTREAELGEERLYKSITTGLPMQQCKLATDMFKVPQPEKVFFISLDAPRRQEWREFLEAGELFRGRDTGFCDKLLSKPNVNFMFKCKFEKHLKLIWQGAAGTFANVEPDKPFNIVIASAPDVLLTSDFWEAVLPALALNPPLGEIQFVATLLALKCDDLMSMITEKIYKVLLESDYRQQEASLRKWRVRPGTFRCTNYFKPDGRPPLGGALPQGEFYAQPGWTAVQLMQLDPFRFTLRRLKDAQFSAKELKDARFSAGDMRAAGFSLKQLSNADFTVEELKKASFSAKDMRAVGFTLKQLSIGVFTAQELVDAGFERSEVSAAIERERI